jgi:hypothetical protein
MVCGWPILDPFFQQLCSRQVMVAASLSLYICWNIHQPMCVGIFSSLCVLEYSASTCMLEYSVTCMLEFSVACMLEYSVTCMLEFSVAWMLDLTRVGKLFSLDSMFGIFSESSYNFGFNLCASSWIQTRVLWWHHHVCACWISACQSASLHLIALLQLSGWSQVLT